jgi:hypothetical protein
VSATKLPQIPSFDGTNTAEVVGAIKEALEVRVGVRGNSLDAAVTFRDMTSLGVLRETGIGSVGNRSLSARVGVEFPLAELPELYNPATDLTTPPPPTDLKATAVFDTVYLSWSQSVFLNQSYWEIWKSFSNDLSSAALAGTSTSQFFVDVAGEDRTVYYWVRTVSAAGIKSAWNSSFGTEVKTGIDPAKLVKAIEGQILESSLSVELAARIEASFDQARASVKRITLESQNRIAAVQAEADARAAAILAEATARGAAITAEATTRQNADNSLASSITTLTASVNSNAAAIQNEATARVSGDAAEASERNTLATQMRGAYTGSDLSALTSGLIYQERIARSAQDSSLAQQITLLSAGSGDQFDWKAIWYFDTGVDGWTGNGTPTASEGHLRAANQASDAHVISPTGINAVGANYSQVRLRVRKVGTPTFAGFLWWRAVSDSTWDTARRVAITAPTFDINGIALISLIPNWTVTIDRIRIDLSSAQTAANYFEIDWVSIGRPAPGASSAQLLEEQSARAAADSAEVTARETLATSLIGQVNPSGLTLATLTSGLVHSERVARSSADSALSSDISLLSATVTGNFNTLNSAISSEATARATGDSAEASARNTLSAQLRGSYTGSDVNALSAGLIYEERVARANADSSLSSSVTTLSSTVSGNTTSIQTQQTTINGIQAKYTVKIDNNGHVSGFGLTSDANNGSPVSAFIVRADKFAIVDPASTANNLTNSPSADAVPFSVVGGAVFIKSAFIQDASISSAKIGSLAANKITAGNINAAIGINGGSVYGASLFAGGTVTVNGDGSFTANNPTFSVLGGDVDIVAPNFRVRSLAAGGSLFTPFEVVGGVVYMNTAFIRNGTITTAQIQNASITNAQIVNLNADKIVGGTISANLLLIDNVTLDTYFDSSIGKNRLRIPDLAVTTAKIGDLSVTSGKIANLSVDTLKIAGNSITLPLTYTAGDVYVSTAILKTGGGYSCGFTFVGYGNGDYEYIVTDYDYGVGDYYYVGPGLGSYTYGCANYPPTFTGAITVIETPWINVGDATDGGAVIVFYATLYANIAADAGQHIYMMIDKGDGNGYLISSETLAGTRTSGGNTTSAIPMAMTYTANNVQNIRIKVVTGTRRVDLSPGVGSNPSYLRNITMSVMGAKR